MSTYLPVEDAYYFLNNLYVDSGLYNLGYSWRRYMKNRDKIKKTIEFDDIELNFYVVDRKTCVNKEELLKKATLHINELKRMKFERENGPIENRGIVHGQFVELYRQDSGMIVSYYVCKKCEKSATTKHEKPQCHMCSDWNGCNSDCTLSHLVCENCSIVQPI